MRAVQKWSGVGFAMAAGLLFAQNTAIQRTVVQTKDISMPGRQAVIAKVEIAPGGSAGRHTHPGEEISYVMDGELEVMIDGQPTVTYKTGEAFVVPAGAKHDAHNPGTKPTKLAATYLVEKGKPLATPAP